MKSAESGGSSSLLGPLTGIPALASLALVALLLPQQRPSEPASRKTEKTRVEQKQEAAPAPLSTCESDLVGVASEFWGLCQPESRPQTESRQLEVVQKPGGTVEIVSKPLEADGERKRQSKEARRSRLERQFRNAGYQARILILMLPDPAFRSLGTMTDSILESFQLGLRDQGYLPFTLGPLGWPVSKVADAKDGDKASTRNNKPGVWLFEKSSPDQRELLFVLTAGEEPVGGVNRPQLDAALASASDFRDLLCAAGLTPSKLLLVGPTFSGSARSLREAILSGPEIPIQGMSGTASADGLSGWLPIQGRFYWDQLAYPDPLSKALDTLIGQMHVDPARIALLLEGHTAYANLSNHNAIDLANIVYLPRDLSLLREAVKSNSQLYERFFPTGNLPSTSLPIPLAGASSAGGMPVYGGETLAKSQETTLYQFAKRLKAEHFHHLGILTTDRLDSLFLARFFNQESPNLGIFLIGSDALFDVENSKGSLTGVLTFSGGPVGIAAAEKLPLASDLGYQVKRAATLLLEGKRGCPVLYLSIIGRGGEWPMRVWGELPHELHFSLGAYIAFALAISFLCAVPCFRYLWPKASHWRVLAPYALPRTVIRIPKENDTNLEGREAKRVLWLYCCFAISAVLIGVSGTLLGIFLSAPGIEWARLRSLTNGVNPYLPLVMLLLSWYSFCWMRVRGRYLDNYSFHVLPVKRNSKVSLIHPGEDLPAEDSLVSNALVRIMQNAFSVRLLALLVLVEFVFLWAYDLEFRDVASGLPAVDWLWTVLGLGTYTAVAYAVLQFFRIWILLGRELRELEAHPIRNAFARLPDKLSWISIWTAGGLRPKFVSMQLGIDYLKVIGATPGRSNFLFGCFLKTAETIQTANYKAEYPDQNVEKDEERHPRQIASLGRLAQAIANDFADDLREVWDEARLEGWRSASMDYTAVDKRKDVDPLGYSGGLRNPALKLDAPDKLKEEFIALLYSSYIRYVFMQLRNIAGFVTIGISALFLALNVYPFQPHGALVNAITFLFLCLSLTFVVVFYQMDADPLLSRIADTQSGKLDSGFAKRLLQFGLLPVLTYLVSQVPELGDALLRVVEIVPGLPK